MVDATPLNIHGYLLDIDGTLLSDDRAIPGASETLSWLRAKGLPFRLLTNTTRRSRRAIAAALGAAGIAAVVPEILTPALLARRLILDSGRTRAALLIPPEARADLDGVLEDDQRPDWVVLGDLGRGFTWRRLNEAFRCLRAGASLLALHKNRFWFAGADGWVLDAGAFVAALEYATGSRAVLVGKPSADFFRLALEEIGLPASKVAVVGDDADTDVAGGAAAGCRTVLVRTGAFQAGPRPAAPPGPDRVIDSIADLLEEIPGPGPSRPLPPS